MTKSSRDISACDWLGERTPAPPPQLGRRLAAIVGDRVCRDLSELSTSLLADAESLIRGLDDDRAGAADLLAADALITYALEAAAEDCARLEDTAADAMARLARIPSRGE